MKRNDFIKIIKIRSVWKLNKGDYKLPSGAPLSKHIATLVRSQMEIDNLLIRENGDLCFGHGGEWNEETKWFDDYVIIVPFGNNETCSYDEMERRIKKLISEIVG